MAKTSPTPEADVDHRALAEENALLRARLQECEEALEAIRNGDVDALVVEQDGRTRLFTLESAEADSNRFRGNALDQVSDAIVAIDSDRRVTFINGAAELQYGVASADVLGRPLTAVFSERWLEPQAEAAAAQALQQIGKWRGESSHRTVDGREIVVESSWSVLRDSAGLPIGQLAAIRDITARRRMDEQLRRTEAALRDADRRKDEFLATLAHELRNPLAPVRNAVAVLKSAKADPATQRWAIAIVERQVQTMALLLDDLLDISRITRGRVALQLQRVPLSSVLDAALEVASPLIEARRHHLTIDRGDPTLEVTADPLRLAQVISNLLTNAAKYTDPEGRIELRIRSHGDFVHIGVTDSGIGLTEESQKKIFEMFSQVGSAIDRSQGGLGIGLALAKGLVTLHGGSIAAHSAGLGCGSTFEVTLPTTANRKCAALRDEAAARRDADLARDQLAADHALRSTDTPASPVDAGPAVPLVAAVSAHGRFSQ